jgi:hypothetical protein
VWRRFWRGIKAASFEEFEGGVGIGVGMAFSGAVPGDGRSWISDIVVYVIF